jgi:vitamin B12 transporter
MVKSIALLTATAVIPTALLHAQEPTHEAVLDAVVVTASRTGQADTDVLAPVTVLTRADIERLQPKDLPDLLAHVPGIDVIRTGGPGSTSSLFLRGANNDHTLFLVDGQRIASATQGTTNFQFIDPEQIERIEVVRGPRSSLYGADAIGGVIQIFTRRGGKPSAHVTAGYGAYGSSQLAAGGQGQWQRVRYSAHVSHFFTEGLNNTRNNKFPANDDDAYRNSSVNLNLGYDFIGGAKLDLDHFYTRTKNEYDGTSATSQPYSDGWMQTTHATLRAPLTRFWNGTWSAGRSFDDLDSFDKLKPTTHTNIRTTRDAASWQNDFALSAAQTLSAGIDYYEDQVDSTTQFKTAAGKPVDSRTNLGYFVQYLLTQGPVEIQAGLREDDNEDYGDKTTGNAALGFALPAQHRFIVSYGTAFKAPTFNQLYFPGFGNPDLQLESSKNYEAELRGDYRRWQWSLNVFENKIDNLIQNVRISPSITLASNVQKARIRGTELVVNGKVENWLLNGSFSYADPRDTSNDNVLVRRARRSLKLEADRQFDGWSLGASWRVQDYRYVDAANTRTLGGYGLIDVHTRYALAKAWTLQLKLTNLLAKKYELNDGYNTERFGWFASVTYRL